jgi:F-box/WD-40 domain protein MET30
MCLQYHTSLTSPSYPVLITGSYDRTIRIWNLDTAALVRQLTGHTRAVRCLQFDQMLLFTGAMDGTVRMWNWRAGECLRVLEGHSDGVICLNYNGYLLATGSADSTIAIWNFRTGKRSVLRGHQEWVNSVVLWDGKTSPGDLDPTRMPSFTTRHRTPASPQPDSNKSIQPGTFTHETSLHEGVDGDKEKLKGPDLDEGAMLFSASDDGTIKLWNLATETCIRTFEGHKAQVQSLRVLMVDMTEEDLLKSNKSSNTSATVSRGRNGRRSVTPPGTGLVSGDQYGLIGGSVSNIMEIDEVGVPIPEGLDMEAVKRGQPGQPRVYLSPPPEDGPGVKGENHGSGSGNGVDGIGERQKKALVVTGSLDGTVKIWDVESGKEVATLFGLVITPKICFIADSSV